MTVKNLSFNRRKFLQFACAGVVSYGAIHLAKNAYIRYRAEEFATQLPSKSFSQNAVSHVVMLLHGYTGNGNGVIGVADELRQSLPDAVFYAPHAPYAAPNQGQNWGAREWFPLPKIDAAHMDAGAPMSMNHLSALCDSVLAKHHVPPERLILIGFSQGGVMALQVGLHRAVVPAAVVSCAGMLANPQTIAQTLTCKPQVLLVHGQQDDIIPVQEMHNAFMALEKTGVPVSSYIDPQAGHSITAQMLQQTNQFLQRIIRV